MKNYLSLVVILAILIGCRQTPVALPVTDAGSIKTMSDASLAAFKITCDMKVGYLMSQGNELEARYWAYTRISIINEQKRRQNLFHQTQ